MANFNVIEIKRLILLSFALFLKREEKQNNILTKQEIIFTDCLKEFKELFNLKSKISKIGSDVSDFLHIIEIALF